MRDARHRSSSGERVGLKSSLERSRLRNDMQAILGKVHEKTLRIDERAGHEQRKKPIVRPTSAALRRNTPQELNGSKP